MGFFLLFSLAVCSSPFSFMIFVKGGSFWWSATKPKQNRKRNQNSEDCLGPRPDHDLFLPFLFLSSSFSVPFLFLQYSFFMSTMFLCPLFPFLSPFHFFRSSFFPLLFLFLFSSFPLPYLSSPIRFPCFPFLSFFHVPLLFVFHVSLSSVSFSCPCTRAEGAQTARASLSAPCCQGPICLMKGFYASPPPLVQVRP